MEVEEGCSSGGRRRGALADEEVEALYRTMDRDFLEKLRVAFELDRANGADAGFCGRRIEIIGRVLESVR